MRLIALLVLISVGCGRTAVRAAEKEYLADPVMVFDENQHETSSDDHIKSEREGASGGHGAAGGGCGCN
ncbi:MAG TPA: DUF4266 domain-containing protein [Kofleriaceae bacterium]|jgi:hypothetical protein